ncbi:hypothetical protein AVHY2522_19205 [Acidovorax sp. SUPP2522]|uniref:hypothetical protein n=1 Tax=unclassified Acidovorax TaxID=2684926 RepID=UPI0023491024|nr:MULTISPECIES: hypothetical protein [unclassified Acidovorax]WCM99989.1 hypothetical protein M5C96_11640 [Acidovorax sp. GBBC 1281]GKT18545.1 hypothetical protein AVHY2522_19205 [Acidovorax sp. SUPP2522]
MIDMMFAAMSVEALPSQQVFVTTTAWTVPAGVSTIFMVCVQPGAYGAVQVVVDGVIVCRAQNGARIGDGGGDGGYGSGAYNDGSTMVAGGGGGAGGYNGAGGNGGTFGSGPTAGTGGGGDGGFAGGGNGIGLKGLGSSPASSPSGYLGGNYGGGSGGANSSSGGSQGGACAWRNNVAVVPGSVVQITVPDVPSYNLQGVGAVRIMWGGGRSYPSNAGDL